MGIAEMFVMKYYEKRSWWDSIIFGAFILIISRLLLTPLFFESGFLDSLSSPFNEFGVIGAIAFVYLFALGMFFLISKFTKRWKIKKNIFLFTLYVLILSLGISYLIEIFLPMVEILGITLSELI